MHKPYVLVAGNIGVGKGLAVDLLSEELGLAAVGSSHHDNPFLDLFYADRRRWAFHSQVYFLQQGLAQHRAIKEQGGVQDRSVHEHFLVFAHQLRDEGVLSAEEFSLLSSLYYGIQPILEPPDLLVMLDASPSFLLDRAQQQYGQEERITVDYLQALHGRYQNFIDSWITSPVLQFDCSASPLEEPKNAEDLVQSVLSHIE